jgi:plasmid stabilization system protein ParE
LRTKRNSAFVVESLPRLPRPADATRVSPQAQSDIDEIAYYVFGESGNVETAERLIDSLTSRFVLLAEYPYPGRQRDHDLRPSVRTFAVGEYVIAYRLDGDSILREQ